MSLWDDAGGEPGVRGVLCALYDALFADAMVGFLFEGKDKEHIVEQQVRFASSFLGGPYTYEGRPLPEAHAALPLLPGHFDRRHHLLGEVLARRGVPEPVAREWLRVDRALRDAVLKSGVGARARAREP